MSREFSWDADSRTLSGRTLVVANDPHEMRIALRTEANWTDVETAVSEGATIREVEANADGIRVVITSKQTGEVRWSIQS